MHEGEIHFLCLLLVPLMGFYYFLYREYLSFYVAHPGLTLSIRDSTPLKTVSGDWGRDGGDSI